MTQFRWKEYEAISWKTSSPSAASYHQGCIARSAIAARPACSAARSAAAAARSVVVPSLSMSESRAVTFHCGK